MSEFRFLSSQSEELEDRIHQIHAKLSGIQPSQAENRSEPVCQAENRSVGLAGDSVGLSAESVGWRGSQLWCSGSLLGCRRNPLAYVGTAILKR